MIKVSEFIEQHKQGNVPKSTLIKMAAFKSELEKTALGSNFLTSARSLMKDSLPMGTAMGMGALIFEAIKGIEKAWTGYRLDATKEPLFQEMLKLHPELGENEKVKERAALYFDSLWHFSPSLAQDPLAAGAYVKQALQMHNVAQGPIPPVVKDLTEIQKNIRQSMPQQEYSTPLGAMFLSMKPQSGSLFGKIDKPEKSTSISVGSGYPGYTSSRTK